MDFINCKVSRLFTYIHKTENRMRTTQLLTDFF